MSKDLKLDELHHDPGYFIQTLPEPDIVNIADSSGEPILSMTSDGQVIWHKIDQADEAADMFTASITRSVEKIAEIKQSREQWELRILDALVREAEKAPLTPEVLTDVVRKCIMVDKLKGLK